MSKLTVRDVEVRDKRVLVRVDFNVPLDDKTGAITDDSRIRATLPTIQYLIDQGARVILATHLGRPEGRVDSKLRVAVVAQRLSQLLGKQVGVTNNCIGAETEKSIETLRSGDVILLENLRFHSSEERDSPIFARALARFADLYVNDAFGTSHRSHTSIVRISEHLPAVAGMLLEKELNTLGGLLENPAHPFAALLGGAKVSDKVGMVENILTKVDCLLIGGGMAATFLKARGYEVGKSLIEEDRLETADNLMQKASDGGVHLLLPIDVVVADDIDAESGVVTVQVENIGKTQRIADIGPQTTKAFYEELRRCRTIFWNGPMGVYEIPRFAEGTRAMAKLIAGSQAATILGGGSTAEIATNMGLAGKMTFISTGGGASLRLLGGEPLPGVEALRDREET
ncbi:MAG TPA: phosphoglycerate kinase [Dehalococcoidales bacterium]|nr:phosphoglycerate kinase [Dehalococcoidales bacterium]